MISFKDYLVGSLSAIGRLGLSYGQSCRHAFHFLKDLVKASTKPPVYYEEFFRYLYVMGYKALGLIALMALFTGMVLAFQIYISFERFSAQGALPEVVALSLVRELAPVLSGLMMAGRWGSSMAAEIGAMQVTDQIYALRTLSVRPLSFLVLPRMLAGMVCLPLLTLVSNSIGLLGGYGVSVFYYHLHGPSYLTKTYQVILGKDINSGLLKAVVFSMIITFIGSYQGIHTKAGAQGVGHSTTNAVVISCLFILLADFILTAFLFKSV